MADFPNRINELRRAAKLTQQQLGDIAGCSKMHVSGLERGDRELNLSWMRRIAKALGVSPADLLSDEDNPDRLAGENAKLMHQMAVADPEVAASIRRLADAATRYDPEPPAQASGAK